MKRKHITKLELEELMLETARKYERERIIKIIEDFIKKHGFEDCDGEYLQAPKQSINNLIKTIKGD